MIKRALTAAAILGLCSCSGSKSMPKGASIPATAAGSTTTSFAAGAGSATTTAVTVTSTHTLGDTASLPGGVAVQVLSYASPVTASDRTVKPAPGHVFAVIDVRACASPSGEHPPGPASFAIQLPDGSQVGPRASVTSPAYLRTALKPTACTRGFVSFQVPDAVRPTLIVLAPSGVAWRVA